ncbi:hypothetical protein ORI89_06515 [Sphingobacterium sp. UT-1RO-CII-1]|uniref:hypothetical protein n=1 Tax=Sphingobacterium sp. UT-1RO-CII-1 TaxID=2995225 RepID=UPI00227BD3EC|nr:hypothetical protein [Sphingobacterium sp. UT-1RO-CII-1]MCY4779295.1 hypothetical protein [Sphingobacterium sp. UT-1RO-CII-1]
MRSTYNHFLTTLFSFAIGSLIFLSSCSKESNENNIPLINPGLKNIVLSGGLTNDVLKIEADIWAVAYVKDQKTGTLFNDTEGIPLKLESISKVQLEEGWLELEKTKDNNLTINLKENFTDTPRSFIIGISAANRIEDIRIDQSKGEGYELVKKEIVEIEGSRKIYTSTDGCTTITLTNGSDKEKSMETSAVFKDVQSLSEFSSDDYGAFEWMDEENPFLLRDEIEENNFIVWAQQVPYLKGISTDNYVKPNSSKTELTVQPFTTVKLSGEIEYLERTSKYTLTIKNKTSGNNFEIEGLWKQKVALSSHLISE